MNESNFICPLEELNVQNLDVLIVGSGPAGVAATERLYEKYPTLKIGIIERGSILTLTHINNIFENKYRRGFIEKFKLNPWEGDLKKGGVLIPYLGGRGIVSGSHLRRFDEDDYNLWENGMWSNKLTEKLPDYYKDAEMMRRVSEGSVTGPSQTWAHGTLNNLNPYPPPIGIDLWTNKGFSTNNGYDSPAARIWKLLIQDAIKLESRRLFLSINSYVTKIHKDKFGHLSLECLDIISGGQKTHSIKSKIIILAASAIESARICLLSKLENELPVTGKFLAEHIERRSKIEVKLPIKGFSTQFVSLVIPPPGKQKIDRFQIHLRGQQMQDVEKLEIDIAGFAAMDPQEDNLVELSKEVDNFGILKANTQMALSEQDIEREYSMCQRIKKVIELLGGEPVTKRFPMEGSVPQYTDNSHIIQKMDFGRSYHEAGTLRIGKDIKSSVTDSFGQVHGLPNLFIADAALFPNVGVANPMLTITALAYRVADKAGEQVNMQST